VSAVIRTEHVGSLLRPASLLEARRRWSDAEIDASALHAAEDAAVVEALRRQEEIGVDIVGDGEFRRTDFRAGFAAAVSGLREDEYETSWYGASGTAVAVTARRWRVVGEVQRTAPMATDEARFLSAHARAPYKITLPSPAYLAERFHSPDVDAPYADVAELAEAFVRIVAEEIDQLVELGVPYIQIDNPGYATFLDADARDRLAAGGRDPDEAFREMLASDCALLEGVHGRDGVTVGLHVCRGNNASTWHHQGGYAPIAEELFAALPVDRLLLEFDDERSGSLDVLRFVPAGKVAVLGLISTKVAEVESADSLIRRLDEAAAYLDPAQLAISPQCGFATHAEGGNHLTVDDQWRKLEVAVQTARRWFGQ
jgi:5-methyltetrahydropteroyltriglutamate--homocysteine methyltransferase